MKEKLASAINFALQNKISEMSCDVSDVIKNKIKDKISEKKKKVAEGFMGESDLAEETFKFTGYASNSPYDNKSNKHEFEVKAKNTKQANDKAIKIMHTKFPDHTHHGVKLVESRYNRDVDFDDEGWGVKNPKMPKFKYGQNNPYKAPPLAKIYHNVPFKQKEEAKAEGMKFDGDKKKWYHTNPESSKKSKFSKLEESFSEKSKEKKLKDKYDSSEMKQKMIDKYGPEKGKAIYFATIRKQAMKEDEEINESLSMMTIKKHYYGLSSDEFKKEYGHPKHVVARIFGWS